MHCQTNRGQELKILEKVHLPSLCKNLSFTMEQKRKKVVIDCESSKRLVHIYGVHENKKMVKQNCGMVGQSGL